MSLPPELWQSIGSYLSEHTLQRMMCVNSAFFRMYMKIRYKMVVISWEKSKAREQVRSLRGSMLSGYVNHLRLCLSPARPPSFEDFTDELLAAVRSMVNLKEISLYFHGSQDDNPEDLQQFFASLWSIVGDFLQSLELSGSLRQYDGYIPSHLLLPSLQRFILNHDKGYLTYGDNKSCH
ncbi:hypothetical protein BDQ17DRAFT_475510 [Cyathus striatus]|nr:hypothetical protein BDQ17DRAFT_475510 [Cyathus striatus]